MISCMVEILRGYQDQLIKFENVANLEGHDAIRVVGYNMWIGT